MSSNPRGRRKGGFIRRRRVCRFCAEKIDYIDYKDVNLLRRFMSDRAKIRARRVTGNDAQQQREVARAIKNALRVAGTMAEDRLNAMIVEQLAATQEAGL